MPLKGAFLGLFGYKIRIFKGISGIFNEIQDKLKYFFSNLIFKIENKILQRKKTFDLISPHLCLYLGRGGQFFSSLVVSKLRAFLVGKTKYTKQPKLTSHMR